MNHNTNTRTRLIQQQDHYIRQLEEQLAVYGEKDKAQELLIEKLIDTECFCAGIFQAEGRTGKRKTLRGISLCE